MPRSETIWFTELVCLRSTRLRTQPNVFPIRNPREIAALCISPSKGRSDSRSGVSSSARRKLGPDHGYFVPERASGLAVYGGRMIDLCPNSRSGVDWHGLFRFPAAALCGRMAGNWQLALG